MNIDIEPYNRDDKKKTIPNDIPIIFVTDYE